MTQKLNAQEVDSRIELFFTEEYLIKISNKLEHKERNTWHYEWEDHLRRFFANNNRIESKIDFADVMINEIDRFAFYCERSLAAIIYHALVELMIHRHKAPGKTDKKHQIVLDEIANHAKSKFDNWDDTLETIDMYAPDKIEDFFDFTCTLMCNPTHRHLALPNHEEDELDRELMYLYSVALYLTYQKFKERQG